MRVPPLSHLDDQGAAHMVDVTAKAATKRTAVAAGSLRTSAQVVELITAGGLAKGDALATACGLPAFWPPSAPAT